MDDNSLTQESAIQYNVSIVMTVPKLKKTLQPGNLLEIGNLG